MKDFIKIGDYLVSKKWDGCQIEVYVGERSAVSTVEIPGELGGMPVYVISGTFKVPQCANHVIIPDSVTSIQHGAFEGNLFSSIHLGAGIESISSIQKLSFIKKITVSPLNKYLEVVGSNVYLKNNETLVMYIEGKIAVGTKYISEFAFYFREIDELILPKTILNLIGPKIKGCSIKKLVVPNSIQRLGGLAIHSSFIEEFVIKDDGGKVNVGSYSVQETHIASLVVDGYAHFEEYSMLIEGLEELKLNRGYYSRNWCGSIPDLDELMIDFNNINCDKGDRNSLIFPNSPIFTGRETVYMGEKHKNKWFEKRFW